MNLVAFVNIAELFAREARSGTSPATVSTRAAVMSARFAVLPTWRLGRCEDWANAVSRDLFAMDVVLSDQAARDGVIFW